MWKGVKLVKFSNRVSQHCNTAYVNIRGSFALEVGVTTSFEGRNCKPLQTRTVPKFPKTSLKVHSVDCCSQKNISTLSTNEPKTAATNFLTYHKCSMPQKYKLSNHKDDLLFLCVKAPQTALVQLSAEEKNIFEGCFYNTLHLLFRHKKLPSINAPFFKMPRLNCTSCVRPLIVYCRQ